MRALVFDTETTGLVLPECAAAQRQPRCIEFYGAIVEDGEILNELEFICDPGEPLSPEITKITGLTTEDVKGKPPFGDYAQRLIDLASQAEVVVAHNLTFDRVIINSEFARLGERFPWPGKSVCTVEATEWLVGRRMSLPELFEWITKEKTSHAHRARGDVQILIRCWRWLSSRVQMV